MQKLLVVAAAGGLGSAVVREALQRNLSVSVLVRSPDKLREVLGPADVARLQAVHVGSAADAASVAAALQGGVDAVISCAPPDPVVAHTLAHACVQAGAKIMWTAGACTAQRVRGTLVPVCAAERVTTAARAGGSNLYEADGVTLHYKAFGPSGDGYYKAHTPCIDAVKATGATHIIWCPGLMKNGQRSTPPPKTLLFADPAGLAAWDFVSYRAC